jgi:hypothetical protein
MTTPVFVLLRVAQAFAIPAAEMTVTLAGGKCERCVFGGKPPVGETQARQTGGLRTGALGWAPLRGVATPTGEARLLAGVLSSRWGIHVHNRHVCGTRTPAPGQLVVRGVTKTLEDGLRCAALIQDADLDPTLIVHGGQEDQTGALLSCSIMIHQTT